MMMLRTLAKALGLLALATAAPASAKSSNSSTSELRYGFGECVDNKRTLYYFTDDNVTCSTAGNGDKLLSKPPVHGLRCDVQCDRGYYLGANFTGEVPVSSCVRCKKGKYSLGGGKLYSKKTKAWTTPLPIDIRSDCVTRNMYSGEWQSNCEPWKASEDGSMIVSGANSDVLNRFEATRLFSTLRISATFVRPGSVTYLFKVDAESPYDGLLFEVDDTAVTPVVSKTDGWKEVSFEVEAGAHTFQWDYTKDYEGDGGEDKAWIKVIELEGTAYSDTYCHTCGGDMTMNGGSLCAFCKTNEYAAAKSDSELDFVCYTCPDGTYAPKGSIGIDSCVQRRACTTDDLLETFTECKNGKRDVSYSWSDPPTCELDLKGSIALPAAQKGLDCGTCPLGYLLSDDNDNTCDTCDVGQKLSDGQCEDCPAGQVTVNAIEFGVGTQDGWSQWPSIIDSVAAKKVGWKLTQNGLVFVPHAHHTNQGKTPHKFPVAFNVSFIHSGFVNITYQLDNVPTFDQDLTRAWLELEVEDTAIGSTPFGSADSDSSDADDTASTGSCGGTDATTDARVVHLLHGCENGTFSELVRVDITTPAVKQFKLVLRTSSPAGERRIKAKIKYIGVQGSEDGGAVACSQCPAGYQASSTDDEDIYGCLPCPAGTYANGDKGCTYCPAGTFSRAGAAKCLSCGMNTYSTVGSATCVAPSTLKYNDSSDTVTVLSSTLPVTYNISLLQSLLWSNNSKNVEAINTSYGFLPATTVLPDKIFAVDHSLSIAAGLFQPLDAAWEGLVSGQMIQNLVDTEEDFPYIVELDMLNVRDAGTMFTQNTGRYGAVQCAAPAQWKVSSGGSQIEIQPLENGTGVQVLYSNGSPCRERGLASTMFTFICDLDAVSTSGPSFMWRDEDACETVIEWRTAYACPICEMSYFGESRSACTSNQQSVAYKMKKACYGGTQPSGTAIATCYSVVLDTKTMYSVYIAVFVVGVVVLVLMVAVLVTHRKYRNAYNDYMYLKGKMPVSVNSTEDGGDETTFEFSPHSNSISDTPAATRAPTPRFTIDEKEEEDTFTNTTEKKEESEEEQVDKDAPLRSV